MKKSALLFLMSALAVSTARAETSINVNIGVPVPRVVAAPPPPHETALPAEPRIVFDFAPLFIAPPRLGFYVGIDVPYDIFFMSDYYYLYHGNSWHRARHYNGPWVIISRRDLPPGIRKHRIERIREYREREHRIYRSDRDHYRGQHFRAGGEVRHGDNREGQRQDRHEIREERRQDRREEQRPDREEHRHDRRDNRGGHDRP